MLYQIRNVHCQRRWMLLLTEKNGVPWIRNSVGSLENTRGLRVKIPLGSQFIFGFDHLLTGNSCFYLEIVSPDYFILLQVKHYTKSLYVVI